MACVARVLTRDSYLEAFGGQGHGRDEQQNEETFGLSRSSDRSMERCLYLSWLGVFRPVFVCTSISRVIM